MAIYFKFKSEKSYDSVAVNVPFISVSSFKQKVYELRYKGKKNATGLCFGNDFDIKVINAQTNDSCDDDNMLIPNHTSLLIQRVPGARRCKFIDTRTIVVPGILIPKSRSASASKSTSNNNNNTKSASASIVTTSSNSSCGNNVPADSSSGKTTEPPVSSTSTFEKKLNDFPVELVCPLCKQPMKHAAFTSRCCFNSFCDKCIRDHLIVSNFNCVCGAPHMLTDYLIPNITVRGLIDSILLSGFTIPQQTPQTSSTNILSMHSPQVSAAHLKCDGTDRVAVQPQTSSASADHLPIEQPQTSISASKSPSILRASADHFPIAQPQAPPMSAANSASVICIAVEEEALQQKFVACDTGNKKRKREISENVAKDRYLMRTGFHPYNSFGMDFNGYTSKASFSIQ